MQCLGRDPPVGAKGRGGEATACGSGEWRTAVRASRTAATTPPLLGHHERPPRDVPAKPPTAAQKERETLMEPRMGNRKVEEKQGRVG